MSQYIWGWELPEDVKAVDYYNRTSEEMATGWYVNNALDKSVAEADCGWSGVYYSVTEDPCCGRREWAVMFANKNDTPREARWIPVTGCSKGAIAEAVWSLVFR